MWHAKVTVLQLLLLLLLVAATGGQCRMFRTGFNGAHSNAESSATVGSLRRTVAPTDAVILRGELVAVVSHNDGTQQWAIRNGDGVMTPIARDFEPPKADVNGRDMQLGAVVKIACYKDAAGVCYPVSNTSISVIPSRSMLLTADTDPVYQRLLVMIMDYSLCGFPSTITEAEARAIFLGPDGDGSGGVAQKYTQCSYGKFSLNVTAFRVVTVKKSCTATTVSYCSWWTMSLDGDTGAEAILGQEAFSDVTHFAYIVPPRVRCPWGGLSMVPGRQIWLATSDYGVRRWATIMQETLHNYGLSHSWQNGIMYGDNSTAMGHGDVCPNAAEISRMGWATPAAPGGDRIDSSALPLGSVLSFTLPATYLTSEGNYLRVVPDWLPTYTTASLAKNLYIAVRVNKSGDELLGSFYANNLNIHEVNATMDNGYPDTWANSDRKTTFIAAIEPNSQRDLTDYKLSVYGGSWVSTDILRVYLCRYQSSAAECPTLEYLETRRAFGTQAGQPVSQTTAYLQQFL
ncbi:metalloproteinase, extracellular matrix glycoprotein VMP27 [Volvox carteri f. nagariensis]|uniref:Metalloproteinase, extracellular matrix glycoprotein VMP27 n=1 Tax=Volvox carteri f. nagariensis TaxID=3068 RepID=D8U3W0_VOLCA|nr:metalloproteinase, extracellular matrix glycoprotein VMP27 [Volvox carteri f. nagariensis]EFJ45677.1 metalloproteinase, extracellular matrix glycoprotein VMP27 [Volvox carteri f. nagariensis]|eukprot:XP_002953367.1 metalloproteinase, extracellular matrix glycoprotein VMP27 [Volvox carteri f. nagariensis]